MTVPRHETQDSARHRLEEEYATYEVEALLIHKLGDQKNRSGFERFTSRTDDRHFYGTHSSMICA